MNTIKKIATSITAKRVIYGVFTIVLILLSFRAGIWVGYQKFEFSRHSDDAYYHGFDERRPGFFSHRGEPPNTHGTIGTVLKIDLPTLLVEDRSNVEKAVVINDRTIIRRFREKIGVHDIQVGNNIAVIGTPNSSGTITAQLIRILPTYSTSAEPVQ